MVGVPERIDKVVKVAAEQGIVLKEIMLEPLDYDMFVAELGYKCFLDLRDVKYYSGIRIKVNE